uniref:Uncharacterized protein n=1 Tax=Chromera velia CCMP2878 TaxID=1169474 RepID=A0A0G4FLG5_9ALVE|eukprot:Cvel_17606.t1-p1 / transcript=Cvel_17606.t1 / gene=Cvel_17606 / organism=Chromera_velia_CCMP2878 / gene_product=hypothetical protein / transcript_product=hypothetical protein / location=Cvel_scaffold1416:8397-14729(-) / protein_length=1309 / sequence_SO=supercontig / SO=protein_coding / is_pseudo=false
MSLQETILQNVDSKLSRGIESLDAGSYESAISDFTRCSFLHPNDPLPFYYRGEAFLALGDLSSAYADFSHALSLDPSLPDVRERLADLKFVRAIRLIDRAQASAASSAVRASMPDSCALPRISLNYRLHSSLSAPSQTQAQAQAVEEKYKGKLLFLKGMCDVWEVLLAGAQVTNDDRFADEGFVSNTPERDGTGQQNPVVSVQANEESNSQMASKDFPPASLSIGSLRGGQPSMTGVGAPCHRPVVFQSCVDSAKESLSKALELDGSLPDAFLLKAALLLALGSASASGLGSRAQLHAVLKAGGPKGGRRSSPSSVNEGVSQRWKAAGLDWAGLTGDGQITSYGQLAASPDGGVFGGGSGSFPPSASGGARVGTGESGDCFAPPQLGMYRSHLPDAVRLMWRAFRLNPLSPHAQKFLAGLQAKAVELVEDARGEVIRGRDHGALKILELALSLSPSFAPALLLRSVVHRRQCPPNVFLSVSEVMKASDGKRGELSLVFIYLQGNFKAALDDIQECAASTEATPQSRHLRADCAASMGGPADLELAIADLQFLQREVKQEALEAYQPIFYGTAYAQEASASMALQGAETAVASLGSTVKTNTTGQTHQQTGGWEVFARLSGVPPPNSADTRARTLLEDGETLGPVGEAEKATHKLELAKKIAEVRCKRAEQHFNEAGAYLEAEAEFSRALAALPSPLPPAFVSLRLRALHGRALCALHGGVPTRALENVDQMLEIQPDFPPAVALRDVYRQSRRRGAPPFLTSILEKQKQIHAAIFKDENLHNVLFPPTSNDRNLLAQFRVADTPEIRIPRVSLDNTDGRGGNAAFPRVWADTVPLLRENLQSQAASAVQSFEDSLTSRTAKGRLGSPIRMCVNTSSSSADPSADAGKVASCRVRQPGFSQSLHKRVNSPLGPSPGPSNVPSLLFPPELANPSVLPPSPKGFGSAATTTRQGPEGAHAQQQAGSVEGTSRVPPNLNGGVEQFRDTQPLQSIHERLCAQLRSGDPNDSAPGTRPLPTPAFGGAPSTVYSAAGGVQSRGEDHADPGRGGESSEAGGGEGKIDGDGGDETERERGGEDKERGSDRMLMEEGKGDDGTVEGHENEEGTGRSSERTYPSAADAQEALPEGTNGDANTNTEGEEENQKSERQAEESGNTDGASGSASRENSQRSVQQTHEDASNSPAQRGPLQSAAFPSFKNLQPTDDSSRDSGKVPAENGGHQQYASPQSEKEKRTPVVPNEQKDPIPEAPARPQVPPEIQEAAKQSLVLGFELGTRKHSMLCQEAAENSVTQRSLFRYRKPGAALKAPRFAFKR